MRWVKALGSALMVTFGLGGVGVVVVARILFGPPEWDWDRG